MLMSTYKITRTTTNKLTKNIQETTRNFKQTHIKHTRKGKKLQTNTQKTYKKRQETSNKHTKNIQEKARNFNCTYKR